MMVMTVSPGSACDPESVTVYDDLGDQNKMYMDQETWEPTNQWADGTPVGRAAFLDVEYVMLICSGDVITLEMKLYDRVTDSTELPSGVKEVNWVIGVYHELVATDWYLDSYAVAINWRGGDLGVTWVDLTDPNGPAVTYLYAISPGGTGVDKITVVLNADRSAKFADCPLWSFGIRVYWNPTENGQPNYGGWFWVDLPDVDALEEGLMEYPWYLPA